MMVIDRDHQYLVKSAWLYMAWLSFSSTSLWRAIAVQVLRAMGDEKLRCVEDSVDLTVALWSLAGFLDDLANRGSNDARTVVSSMPEMLFRPVLRMAKHVPSYSFGRTGGLYACIGGGLRSICRAWDAIFLFYWHKAICIWRLISWAPYGWVS